MVKTKSEIFVFTPLLLIASTQLFAQLVIDTTLAPTQLVQNVLLGSGITASNIVYKGVHSGTNLAIAKFSGTTNLGIASGIVMTTGTTTGPDGPQGPNNLKYAGIDNGYAGDSLLTAIASNLAGTPVQTYNAAVLEFDFVPTSDTIKFRYVFGSEEYPENACTVFNDIFGFFISGPNPLGGNYSQQNIALIPGTALPVCINTVNAGPGSPTVTCGVTYPQYYVNNGTGSPGDPKNGKTIQYNGFITPLTAYASVICGSTYHIKIAIADARDGVYDSGVFLEAGSFSSKSISLNSKLSLSENDSTLYEGCGQSSIVLRRPVSDIGNVDSIGYTITGTATYGADYSLSSSNIKGNKIIFPAGVDSIQLNFNALKDQIREGLEYFTITISFKQCNKIFQKTLKIYIEDVKPITLTAGNDTTINCPNKTLPLKAIVSGGISSDIFKYSWNTGSKSDNITVNPKTTSQYIVSITDSTCSQYTATDTININVNYTPLTMGITKSLSICEKDSAGLAASPNFGTPAYTFIWQPGGLTSGSINVSPANTTNYTVTATDNCGLQISRTTSVHVFKTEAVFDYSFQGNGEIDFMNNSVDASNYLWTFGDKDSSSVSDPIHTYADTGTYKVMLIVTNAIGCIDTIEHTVIVLSDLYFYFPNSFTPNGDGKNDEFGGKGVGVKSYKLTIYDRWGKVIFKSDNLNNTWDGNTTRRGKASEDNYICVFDVEDNRGNFIHKIGTIALVR